MDEPTFDEEATDGNTSPLPISILLAEDDYDDCFLFSEALQELKLATRLTCVKDGEQLMGYLQSCHGALPDVIFLDINMPRKNGHQCLMEIKKDPRLNSIPIVVLSTANEPNRVKLLLNAGALSYFMKPDEFGILKKIITQVLGQIRELRGLAPPKIINHESEG